MILTLVDHSAVERASFEKEFVDFFNKERILIFAVRYISAVLCKYFVVFHPTMLKNVVGWIFLLFYFDVLIFVCTFASLYTAGW